MPLRYYPASKVKPNRRTSGGEFTLEGRPYSGYYYETYDGRFFTGKNPVIGENEELFRIEAYNTAQYLNNASLPQSFRTQLAVQTRLIGQPLPISPNFKGSPTSYFPLPLESDYLAGRFFRYFTKRINTPGMVIEISKTEYDAINAGQVPYDVSMWQTLELFWKLTGPLKTKRLSQYNIRAGIEDTNKRLVENAEKTFVGIKAFIGEEYTKYSRVTE